MGILADIPRGRGPVGIRRVLFRRGPVGRMECDKPRWLDSGMSNVLITAALTSAVAAGASEFVFLPEGKRRIFPQSQKDGIEINVPAERGIAIAAALQEDLDKRLRENVEPWFDFEHTRKSPKSGYPKSFRYEKGRGVICSVEWSRSGRIALRGRDVNHFSPEFHVDADGIPNGLPSRGPVGALCAEPAFRDLPRIAASATDIDPDSNENAMSKFLILASIGLLTEHEAARDDAESLARARVTAMRQDGTDLADARVKVTAAETELTTLRTKVTAAEADAKKAKTKAGEELFERAVKAGLAAAKDDAAKGKFVSAAEADNEFALELLREKVTAAESGQGGSGLGRPIIGGGGEQRQRVVAGEHAFETKARSLVTASQAKDLDSAMEIVAASEPKLYGDYLKSLTPAG